jgi:hypothetical protein
MSFFRSKAQQLLLLVFAPAVCAQMPASMPAAVVANGQVERDGGTVAYQIRRLPVSSFPELPFTIAAELSEMGCMIPQTFEARKPENVVHASLERPGSSDWAVLCSEKGDVLLLVFLGSQSGRHMQLASSRETDRLQRRRSSDVLGFNWGIDPATPDRVHEAQIGMNPRPQRIEHDALADSAIDSKTIYHYYAGGVWIALDMPD